ncbi:hypothetical protein [Streptomyces sp. IBSBF 2435]|uniref:hypothetical protein n=1 Tax=Streptomyces sp. IBSBF 2435 TaxID=2903531 RepID=UPI002FDC02E1
MSSDFPPPQQPPVGQNPYAQQPPPGPQQPYAPSPYVTPPQGGAPFNAAAYAPPAPIGAPPRGNPGLAVVAGVAAMLVAAFAYAGIMRAMAKDDGHYTEVGYLALAVGLLIGFALGKIGGRNPVLPFVGIVLALLGVFLGEMVGLSMIASHYASQAGLDISWFSMLTDHGGDVFRQWKHDFDAKSFFFLAIAGLEGFVVTRRVAN